MGVLLGVVVAVASGTHFLDNRFHQGEVDRLTLRYQGELRQLQAEVNSMKYLLQITHTEDYRPVAKKLKGIKGDEEEGQGPV